MLTRVPHHLMGVAEVADRLGVSRQRVDQLASSYPDFPQPEVELAAGRIWTAEAVDAWIATHPDRAPGRREGVPISYDRLTDRARRAFALAQTQARSLGYNYAGCEHLVLGLCEEGEGVAARALEACGLTLETAREVLRRLLGPGVLPHSTAALPLTPRVSRALGRAQETALEFGHNYIGTEHLLLGVLREGANVGCRLLVEAGIDLTRLRLKVLEIMGFPQPKEGPDDRQGSRALLASIDARLERLEQRLVGKNLGEAGTTD